MLIRVDGFGDGFVYFGLPKDFVGIRNNVFIKKENIICKELKAS